MPPKYYPYFRHVPNSLVDKRTVMLARTFVRAARSGSIFKVDRIDYQDEQPLEPPMKRIKRSFWNNRADYLFMLIFLSISILDAWNCIALTIKEGGYIIIVYVVIRCSFAVAISYIIVFIAVYTKKTVLGVGRMLPVLTGFGYLLLFVATLRAVSKMRLVTSFSVFVYFSISQDFTSCKHFSLTGNNNLSVPCINIKNLAELSRIGLNEKCKSLRHSLLIVCGNGKPFILSTSSISQFFFYNVRMKYLTLVLAFFSYGLMLYFIRKEQPYFVKITRAALTALIGFNLYLIITAYFIPGCDELLRRLFTFSSWPTLEGLFLAIALALPNVSEVFISVTATTGRLPLCTVPAIDCALMCFVQVFMIVVMSASNLMIIGAMSHNLNMSPTAFAGEFIPYITAPYFCSLMPVQAEFWILLFFLIHAFHDFIKELLLVEAIFVNIVWRFGMSKLFFTIIHIFIFCAVMYLFLTPDNDDINASFMHCVVINLPILTIFCFGLVIYGVRRLEEDITFMTSSPPSELLSRFLKILPVACLGLLIWGRVYIRDTLDQIVHYGILMSFISELILRLAFIRQESDPPCAPRPNFGPPSITLRNERKAFSTETRKAMDSSASRAFFNQNK